MLCIYLINPFNYGFLIGYIIFILLILNKNFIRRSLDFNLLIISTFSALYAIYYALGATESQGIQYIIIYAITAPSFFLLGKFIIEGQERTKTPFYSLFIIATLFSISAIISVFLNFLEGGFAQLQRNLPMFWTGERVAATVMGAFITLNMCIPAILISNFSKLKWPFRIFAIVLFLVSLICVIRLGSRTQLVILGFTSVLAILFSYRVNTFRYNLVVFLILAGLIYWAMSKINLDANQEWLTTYADRMGSREAGISTGGGRTEKWMKSLGRIFTHPLGWSVKDFGHSHNMWLDVLRAAGVLPFILLWIYTFKSLKQILLLLKNDSVPSMVASIVLLYGIAFLLIFMVEPIFEGIYSLFATFCLYIGIITQINLATLEK